MSPLSTRAARYAVSLLAFFAPMAANGCVVLPISLMPAEELFARFDAISFGRVSDEKFEQSRLVSVTVVVSESIKGYSAKEIVIPMPTEGFFAMCMRMPPKLGETAIVTVVENVYRVEPFDPSSPYAGSLRALKKKATSNSMAEPDARSTARAARRER